MTKSGHEASLTINELRDGRDDERTRWRHDYYVRLAHISTAALIARDMGITPEVVTMGFTTHHIFHGNREQIASIVRAMLDEYRLDPTYIIVDPHTPEAERRLAHRIPEVVQVLMAPDKESEPEL